MEKRAQQRIYQINPDTMLEPEEWAKQMTQLWNQRFDALDKVLMEEKRKGGKNDKGESKWKGSNDRAHIRRAT